MLKLFTTCAALLLVAMLLAACGSVPAADQNNQFALAATVAASTAAPAVAATTDASTNVAASPIAAPTDDGAATAQAVAQATAAAADRATVVAFATEAVWVKATADARAANAAVAASAEIAAATAIASPSAASTAAPTASLPAASATLAPNLPAASATLAPTLAPSATAPAAVAPAPSATVAAAPAVDCAEPCEIRFSELYAGASITGPILSDKAKALAGKRVIMRGFMAPPLAAEAPFFVLTKTPMVYCPFCSTATDWPFDIVYVKMAGGRSIPTLTPTVGIVVVGTFELGAWTDPETGFVSLVRIFADSVEEAG